MRYLRRQSRLRQARITPTLLLMLLLAGYELWSNASPNDLFGTAYTFGKPFRSAMIDSGVEKRLEVADVNVLFVLVEGRGRLVDNRQQELNMAPLHDRTLTDRYALRQGATEFYGSTTAAEMRELCASRQPYTDLTVDSSGIDCLPARLARRGYETHAFNGFTGKMFDLESWYPRVGFRRLTFAEQLLPTMNRTCGAVFRGACDVDVASQVAESLQAPGGPRFVYWLTLNTHIPVRPGDATPRFGCNTPGSAFADTEVCWMAELWTDVLEQVARITRDPALPPTAFLIVGDHAPPLWSCRARQSFRPGEFSWASLRPRAGTGTPVNP